MLLELTILFDELMAEAENWKWQKYRDLVEIESQSFDLNFAHHRGWFERVHLLLSGNIH